jgi:signal peptidase
MSRADRRVTVPADSEHSNQDWANTQAMGPPGVGDDEPVGEDSPDGTTSSEHSATEQRPGESPTDERDEWVRFGYDVVSSVLAVAIVGVLLFAVSGVWPPMVAVESPSMTPHMQTGDLVFVMEEHRFSGEEAHEGVVTARTGSDVEYRKFGQPGDVIVYNPDGNAGRTPIIHRAMFWVEEGENWYEKADRQSVGRYSECDGLPNCPAPHDGFITKGDANGVYDQAQGSTGLSRPVKPAWVVGTAEVRVPLLGCIRLRTEGCFSLFAPSVATAAPDGGAVTAGSPAGSPERVGHLVGVDRERAAVVVDHEFDPARGLEVVECHSRADSAVPRHHDPGGTERYPDAVVFDSHVPGFAESA